MLNVYDFGRELLETNDLDPVYVMLWNAQLPPDELDRWLIAYWCFYHAGTASWITDSPKLYWTRFRQAAASKEYPRCHERRHFRGALANKSALWLSQQGRKALMNPIRDRGYWTATALIEYVKTWVGFGPWIAFKVADMVERLDIAKVKFDTATAMYDGSPTKGAQLLYSELVANPLNSVPMMSNDQEANQWVLQHLIDCFYDQKAPPRYERPINAQEAETILCKWKSYRGGHYTLGEDVEGLRRGLLRFPTCKLSQRLLKHAPRARQVG